MTVGSVIKSKRIEAGITQIELARAVGSTQNAISSIECGASNPSLDMLNRIVDALGCTIEIIKRGRL